MKLPHGDVFTPVYMPVGTKGTIKGLTSYEMENLNCKILLGKNILVIIRIIDIKIMHFYIVFRQYVSFGFSTWS